MPTLLFVFLCQTVLAHGAAIVPDQRSGNKPIGFRSFGDTLIADGGNFGKMSLRMLLVPFHARGRDLLNAAGLATVVALSSTLDKSVRDGMNGLDRPWADAVSDVGRFYQNKYVTFAAAGIFYSYGALRGSPAVRRIGLEIIEAFEISVIGSSLLKHLVGRDRPFVERGAYHFVGPNANDNHQSFISGDATKAFTLSAVLSAEAKSIPVTILLYSLAAATAFQRLHTDRHWLSDTMGAAAWGTAVGLGTVYLNHRHDRAPVRLSAEPGDGTVQLLLPISTHSIADALSGIRL
jgi:membrane-associated phospholipid phosphatase